MTPPGSMSGRGAVAKRASAAHPAAGAPPISPGAARRSRTGGFTLIELLTVVAIVGILASLILTAISGAKKRTRVTACSGNLRQVAMAVEIYQDEAGRRPRSFTRLATRPEILPNPRSLLCPDDPTQRARAKKPSQSAPSAWGNVVNTSQEPMDHLDFKTDLEAPTWEQEMLDVKETVGFSYLHPLCWRKSAWKVLSEFGNHYGVGVCQVHGINLVPVDKVNPQGKGYLSWEGLTLRAQRDGAVISRKIFRGSNLRPGGGNGGGIVITPVIPGDYPWEFYLDTLPNRAPRI